MDSQRTDEELLRSFLGGDENAFEMLVRRYEAPLRRLAYGFLRDAAFSEDVAQDAFLRAYRKASSFHFGEAGGSFKRWLYRIAVNRAQDELRRRRRRPEADLAAAPEPGTAPDGVEHAAAARERGAQVARALAEIRPEHRQALVLKDVEGMTYAEIAKLLGWPLGTVQVRVHRARLELRDRLHMPRGGSSGGRR